MSYDDWKTESPEDEQERLGRTGRRKYPDPDTKEGAEYWDQKIDEARER